MKRIVSLFLLVLLSISCFAACSEGNDVSGDASDGSYTYTTTTLDKNKTYFAVIDITDYGVITVKLDQEQAPITVENFVTLANNGFYNGLTFHRIMEGFMMQGGDPNGDGTGDSGKDIVGEFSANGYSNNISHKRGVISMARANPYNSGSCQFFICHEDSTFLDGKYAAFGYVVTGMDVVDKVCESARPTDNNGSIAKKEQPIIKSIEIKTDLVINTDESSIGDTSSDNSEDNLPEVTNGAYYAEIDIENYGTVTLLLNHHVAPITVENFVTLARNGFYDGLTFHRIMEGFMMQGGDPNGNGTGGSDKTIVGEFLANGYNNTISHKRGVISMARASAYNSASSQFFICHQDSTFLDGQYAAFGWVVEGMEIIDEICTSAEPTDNNGTIPKDKQPIITSIQIIEEE